MSYLPRLALLVLAALFSGQVQAQILPFDQLELEAQAIASDDPCAIDLGVPSPSDNLSCEFVNGGTFCYTRAELCNTNPACFTLSDEGENIAALDCKFCMQIIILLFMNGFFLSLAYQVQEIEPGQVVQFLYVLLERMLNWISFVMATLIVVLETMKLLHFARVSYYYGNVDPQINTLS